MAGASAQTVAEPSKGRRMSPAAAAKRPRIALVGVFTAQAGGSSVREPQTLGAFLSGDGCVLILHFERAEAKDTAVDPDPDAMQLSLLLPTAAALLLAPSMGATTTSKLYPGRCSTVKDCASYGSNYACVAVTSDVAGVELLNMCIPGSQVCSGSIAGLCPTFSSWPSKYRVIQPVCAFIEVANCNLKHTVTVTSGSGSDSTTTTVGDATATASAFIADANSSSSSSEGTVECYSRNFTSGDEYVVVNGIYQCVDYAKYVSSNGGHLEALTEALVDECGYNATASTLCSGQGTCSPDESFSQTYECKCNAGYNTTEFCSKATSNTCSSVSQCGTMGTCTSGSCVCDAGATGNQCALCDPTSSAACSGHGDCSSSGVCSCDSDYTGTFCGEKKSSSSSSSSSSSESAASATTADSAAMTLSSSLVGVAVAVVSLLVASA